LCPFHPPFYDLVSSLRVSPGFFFYPDPKATFGSLALVLPRATMLRPNFRACLNGLNMFPPCRSLSPRGVQTFAVFSSDFCFFIFDRSCDSRLIPPGIWLVVFSPWRLIPLYRFPLVFSPDFRYSPPQKLGEFLITRFFFVSLLWCPFPPPLWKIFSRFFVPPRSLLEEFLAFQNFFSSKSPSLTPNPSPARLQPESPFLVFIYFVQSHSSPV